MKIFWLQLAFSAVLILFGLGIDFYLDSRNIELLFYNDALLSDIFGNNIGILFAGSILLLFSLPYNLTIKWKELKTKDKVVTIILILISLLFFTLSTTHLIRFFLLK